ncbi:DUF5131 family protein [Methylobacterium currus]|nr:DUF5131 family protein [Methylobacterium currus]
MLVAIASGLGRGQQRGGARVTEECRQCLAHHGEWARSLRDQCAAAGVPFLFKQQGAWMHSPGLAGAMASNGLVLWPNGDVGAGDESRCGGRGAVMLRVGKKRAGRLLDGVTHDGFPTL